MGIAEGFDRLQKTVDVPADVMSEARRRRDLFRDALPKALDVIEVIPTGSLARGTHKDPLHDVDLVCLFDPHAHADWGEPGPSADDALGHLRWLINEFFGEDGSEGHEVRLMRKQNHALKCFMDDPDGEAPFTVDVTPALRHGERGLIIPERRAQRWIRSDPEYLMEEVARRHSEWSQFAKMVRVLKRWSADHGSGMKSLVVEVLALDHLPTLNRSEALAKFFAAATSAVMNPVVDPAGLCGEIQPDLDRDAAREALAKAADSSWRAVDAYGRGEEARAMCLWRDVFGPIFPEPEGGCTKAKDAAALITGGLARPKRKIVDAPQG
ncbi:MAG TPA: nucleotidyltransferase domain-containing protein [Actinomycetota bacterium]|nr:nucleotidyltransferase domain-containing protein [Actinomycetota bacterium]